MTKKSDPRIGLWILLAFFLLAGLAGFALFMLLPSAGWCSAIVVRCSCSAPSPR